MRSVRICLAAVTVGCLLALGACSTPAAQGQHARDRSWVSSDHALVIPSSGGRLTAVLAGMAEPGSDLGVFAARRDARIGALEAGPERVTFGYERRIYDRQYSSLGRPFNSYMNTTRSTTRVDR